MSEAYIVPGDVIHRYTGRDVTFLRACELGCTPIYTGRWECRCPNTEHGDSTVDPVISADALDRFVEAHK